jgi:hypothetical protein
VAFFAFLLGIAAGGGAVLWRQAGPEPPAFHPDEHAVELVLFEAVPPRTPPRERVSGIGPLQLDGALLLSGLVTSTVLEVAARSRGLAVSAPSLPVTVSPTSRFQPFSLSISVRDCRTASPWAPGDRPFTISWRDEYGRVHLDRAGDFGRNVALSLIGYVDAVCEAPRGR